MYAQSIKYLLLLFLSVGAFSCVPAKKIEAANKSLAYKIKVKDKLQSELNMYGAEHRLLSDSLSGLKSLYTNH